MSATTPPKARATSTAIGILAALLVLALGVVGLQEWLSGIGWVDEDGWVSRVIATLDEQRPEAWMIVVAVPAALIGVWLVLVALKPRSRTHLPAPGGLDLWATPAALAAIAQNAADRQPGVVSAIARPGRRRIDVEVRTDRSPSEVESQVHEAVVQSLEGVSARPVRIRATAVAQ